MRWVILGQAAFGFLIGCITGLSETPVANTLLPLVFAYAGGSIAALTLSVSVSMSPEQMKFVGSQMVVFPIGSLLGLFLGIYLRLKKHFSIPISHR